MASHRRFKGSKGLKHSNSSSTLLLLPSTSPTVYEHNKTWGSNIDQDTRELFPGFNSMKTEIQIKKEEKIPLLE